MTIMELLKSEEPVHISCADRLLWWDEYTSVWVVSEQSRGRNSNVILRSSDEAAAVAALKGES